MISDNLTPFELSFACWAIEHSAGEVVLSDEAAETLDKIMAEAVRSGGLDDIRARKVMKAIRGGGPARHESAEPEIPPAIALLDPFLRELPVGHEVVLAWAHSMEEEIPAEPIPEKDLARQIEQVVEALVDSAVHNDVGIPMYAVKPQPLQREISESLVELLRALEMRHRSADLSNCRLAEIKTKLSIDRPALVIVIPPLGPWTEDEVRQDGQFAREVLGIDINDAHLRFGRHESFLSEIASTLRPGSRMVWFGYQARGGPSPGPRGLQRAFRERLAQYCSSLHIAHFRLGATPKLAEFLLPFGGQSLHVADIGPQNCQLNIDEVRSWTDWFSRVRPNWCEARRRGDIERGPRPVTVTSAEINVPWSYEFMGPAAYEFRQQFHLYGEWVRLADVGVFSSVFEEHWDDWIADHVVDEKHRSAVAIPAPRNFAHAQNWADGDPTHIFLDGSTRDQWEGALLRRGDLLFNHVSNPTESDLHDAVIAVDDALAGAVATHDTAGLLAFTFKDDVTEGVKQWVADFLRSPLGDRWVRIQGYDDWDAHPIDMWGGLPIPLPDPGHLAAYQDSYNAVERLRAVAAEIETQRAGILGVHERGPRWERLRNLAVRSSAVRLLLTETPAADLPIRLSYPFPLSFGMRAFRSAQELDRKLALGLALAENVAALMCTFWLALQRTQEDGIPEGARAYLHSRLENGLSFGTHLTLLRQHAIPSVKASPLVRVLPPATMGACSEMLMPANELRNRHSHLLGPGRESLMDAVKSLEELLYRCLSAFEPLANLRLLFVEHAENDPVHDRCIGYRARLMAGDHPDGWLVENDSEQPEPVFPRILYLQAPATPLVPVSPFLSYQGDDPMRDIGVLNSTDGSRAEFRSLTSRESWLDQSAAVQLETVLLDSC